MQAKKELPSLYKLDAKGKQRIWKCWVIGETVYREYGPVDGKKIIAERTFDTKSPGNKNETTPEEQAWKEANKEWVQNINRGYLPDENDKKGQILLKNLKNAVKETGNNVNAVAAISKETKTKTITRKKEDTNMVNEVHCGDVIPMKAQTWELDDDSDPYSVSQKVEKYFSALTGKGKSMKLESTPFLAQPKLDGWRCRVMIQNVVKLCNCGSENHDHAEGNKHEIVLTTNSAKQYRWFSKLRKELLEWLTLCDKSDILDGLDGELYTPTLFDLNGNEISSDARFATISSICGVARSNPHELEDQIQFHCFDLIDVSGTFTQVERFEKRDKLFKKLPKNFVNIIKVETVVFDCVEKVVDYHGECAEKGYEGCIMRTFGLKYKPGTRSPELRKFKLFKDAEYKIVGCKLDKGVAQEQFVWVLVTEDGKEFSAKPMGTREEKIQWYADRKKHIGKYATVKFQDFSEDNIPRFPIFKSFRTGPSVD